MARRSTSVIALALSVLLGTAGTTIVGCSSQNKPGPDAAKYEDPGTAMQNMPSAPGVKEDRTQKPTK